MASAARWSPQPRWPRSPGGPHELSRGWPLPAAGFCLNAGCLLPRFGQNWPGKRSRSALLRVVPLHGCAVRGALSTSLRPHLGREPAQGSPLELGGGPPQSGRRFQDRAGTMSPCAAGREGFGIGSYSLQGEAPLVMANRVRARTCVRVKGLGLSKNPGSRGGELDHPFSLPQHLLKALPSLACSVRAGHGDATELTWLPGVEENFPGSRISSCAEGTVRIRLSCSVATGVR